VWTANTWNAHAAGRGSLPAAIESAKSEEAECLGAKNRVFSRDTGFVVLDCSSLLHIPPSYSNLGVGLLCNLIRIGVNSMLLTSTGVIPKSQLEEESALLRCKIEELNRNTVRLIAEAEKLVQETKQLSTQMKSLENASTKPTWPLMH